MDTQNLKELSVQVPQGIRWNAEGLVPAIVQDADTKEVLMLAYMNEEALRLTIQDQRAWYYSRSRQSLWLKGETSGNTQEVVELRFDCDCDSILLMVKQKGVACHEDFYSCFHYGVQGEGYVTLGQPKEIPQIPLGRTLELLAQVIHSRNQERPEGAYTTYLFEKGIDKILKKVGEECTESIIAAKNASQEEMRYEVADLFYHVLVMLEERGVSLADISQELLSRRK